MNAGAEPTKKYGTATSLLRAVMILGWLAVGLGIAIGLIGIVGASKTNSSAMPFLLAGTLALVINGVIVVAIAQVGQAVIDTALTTSKILVLISRQIENDQPGELESSEEVAEIAREIQFNCPFCGEGMYNFGRCPKCRNTVDQPALDAHKNR